MAEIKSPANVEQQAPSEVEVSVVTGTLNESGNIETFINSIESTLSQIESHEIIVVDDNSNDGTSELLGRMALDNRHLRFIVNPGRLGLLNSNLQGIGMSRGKFIVVMDSDLQHPSHNVIDVVKKLKSGSDIVICSRYTNGGSVGQRNPIRGVISRGAVFLARLLIPGARHSTDPISGYFGFRSGLLVPKCADGAFFKTLTLLLALNSDKTITEVPYAFGKRTAGESKIVSRWNFSIDYIMELILLRKIVMRHARHSVDRYSSYADLPVKKVETLSELTPEDRI